MRDCYKILHVFCVRILKQVYFFFDFVVWMLSNVSGYLNMFDYSIFLLCYFLL